MLFWVLTLFSACQIYENYTEMPVYARHFCLAFGYMFSNLSPSITWCCITLTPTDNLYTSLFILYTPSVTYLWQTWRCFLLRLGMTIFLNFLYMAAISLEDLSLIKSNLPRAPMAKWQHLCNPSTFRLLSHMGQHFHRTSHTNGEILATLRSFLSPCFG